MAVFSVLQYTILSALGSKHFIGKGEGQEEGKYQGIQDVRESKLHYKK